jgi:hypothetical protein
MIEDSSLTSQTQATGINAANTFIAGIVDNQWNQFAGSLFEPSVRRVVNVTASTRAVTAAESGTTFVNNGASATVTLNLPPATVGLHFTALVRAAQALRLDPSGSEIIANATAGGADGGAGKYIGLNTPGAAIHLLCVVAGRWDVVDVKGAWALEA